jgi:uncharacterized protein (DUF885 family)
MRDRRFLLSHTVAALLWAASSVSVLAAPKKKKKTTKSTKKSKKSAKSKKKPPRPAPPPPPPPVTRIEDRDSLKQVLGSFGREPSIVNSGTLLSQRTAQVSQLRRLRQNVLSLPRSLYHQNDRVVYDAVLWELGLRIEGAERFGVGAYSKPEPYHVTPYEGLYRNGPAHLEHSLDVTNEAEDNAYLEKLNNLVTNIAQETELMKSEQASFGLMPDFLIKSTLLHLKSIIDHNPLTHPLTLGLEKKARKAGLAAGWGEKAVAIFEEKLRPQLTRQSDLLRSGLGRAQSYASIRHHPKGEAYYDWALRFYTDSDLKARDLHEMGLKKLLSLQSSLDMRLRGLGFGRGSVAERLKALRADPQYLYPATDEGLAQLSSDSQARISNLDAVMAGRLNRTESYELRPIFVSQFGASGPDGYDYKARIDEANSYGLLLIDSDAWRLKPLWQHSAILSQIAGSGLHGLNDAVRNGGEYGLANHIASPSFTEGWAHYAADLADEAGFYEEDALGKIGYLEKGFEQAVLAVIDTGIHHLGWSREQAVVKLAIHLGTNADQARGFVDYIVAFPAKVLAGFYGRSRWQALRSASRSRLGARFDQNRFHTMGLSMGRLSMDHIELICKNEKMV